MENVLRIVFFIVLLRGLWVINRRLIEQVESDNYLGTIEEDNKNG